MSAKIQKSIKDAIRAIQQLDTLEALTFIKESASLLSQAFTQGQKVLIAGNGGSLCDATHFAEELTGNFRHYREALPAIALADPGHITCVANDFGYEWIFARAIEALGKEGDVFVGLTTSGNSSNMIHAFETAKKRGLKTIAFLGKGGGKLKGSADLEFCVKEEFFTSDRIQEVHMAAIHLLIEQIEELLFPQETSSLSCSLKDLCL